METINQSIDNEEIPIKLSFQSDKHNLPHLFPEPKINKPVNSISISSSLIPQGDSCAQ